jgi:hypothetical protein
MRKDKKPKAESSVPSMPKITYDMIRSDVVRHTDDVWIICPTILSLALEFQHVPLDALIDLGRSCIAYDPEIQSFRLRAKADDTLSNLRLDGYGITFSAIAKTGLYPPREQGAAERFNLILKAEDENVERRNKAPSKKQAATQSGTTATTSTGGSQGDRPGPMVSATATTATTADAPKKEQKLKQTQGPKGTQGDKSGTSK